MNATTAWALCLLLAAGGAARAQDVDRAATFGTPTASDGGTAVLQPTQPIDAQRDPVNEKVQKETVDGLIVVVTIDGANVRLDSATPARVPRKASQPAKQAAPEQVTVSGLVGGNAVTRNVVLDPVVRIQEGQGVVRVDQRQITVALATDRALEAIRVQAPATHADQTLDVRDAYAPYCKNDPRGAWCPAAKRP